MSGYHASRLVAVVLIALLRSHALGQTGEDVRDHGARGDGQTDDTAAIQAAIDAVGGVSQPYPGTAYYNEMEAIHFPPGHYRISDTLRIGNGRIIGDGAVIEQTNPDRDVFAADSAWRLSISGFTFLGGRNHLVLHNPNLDTGQVHIDRCRFYGARGVALDVDIVSTTLAVRDCIFLECGQVWVNRGCDQAVMRDCWITTHHAMRDRAAIEHRGGRLTIENLCGVPLVNGDEQRWIDNYGGNLTCRQCRFGGEGGGFTAVVNYARYNLPLGPTILLDDCLICGGTAVRCEAIPNQLHVRDCLFGGGVPVRVRDDLDLSTYFQATGGASFSFSATGNTGCSSDRLPPGLARPKLNPLPPVGLSDEQAREALQRAVRAQATTAAEDAAGGEFGGHQQASEPGGYVDLLPGPDARWHVQDFMDASQRRNAEHLAFQRVGSDVVIMRRTSAQDNWPHVTLEGVTLDLDRFPFLAWKQKPTGTPSPGTYAVRVDDVNSGQSLLLEENYYPPWDAYRSYNLRELLGGGGVRALRIRYYYLGIQSINKTTLYAQPEDFIVLDFLRAERQ
jgi:hypothetical protein